MPSSSRQGGIRGCGGCTACEATNGPVACSHGPGVVERWSRTGRVHPPLVVIGSGSPTWYEVRYGRQAADRYWFWDWALVSVTSTDARLRRQAVETLQQMLHLSYYTEALIPASRPQLAEEVRSARSGHLDELSTDLRLNC